jgi:GTP-sensing pleiotropic transcriptional regulator CodY
LDQVKSEFQAVRNLIHAAIDDSDGEHAAKVIRDALGIESDEVVNLVYRSTGQIAASNVPAS